MPSTHFDLIVLGSGPAGEKGAAQAAYFGKSVAMVEAEPVLGGAAANTGTLPSKTLRESALFLSGFKQRDLHGITVGLQDKVSARDFLYRERLVVQSEHARIADNLKRHHVQLFRGRGTLIDAHTVAITPEHSASTQITGDVILIATGSHPHHPNVIPFHDRRVFDSDTILNIHDIPASMVVAGGGVIGCEYACIFAALGINVILIEGRERLLTFMDGDISRALARSMARNGIELYLNDSIAEVDAGGERLAVRLTSGKYVVADAILGATGRTGNSSDLGLEGAGVKLAARGAIEVNERYQTTTPNIYAVGDVIGFPALASTSMEQARIAMVHAFDLKYKTTLAPILPYGIYTIPECSAAGETEEALQKKGVAYVAGRAGYNANARGQIIGDDDGFLKLLFERDTMQLLGVHVIGEQATELVHVGLTALLAKADVNIFIQACFNYPTLSELYKYAAYSALDARARTETLMSAAI
jgi:NAD(P) transhydrogenase